MKHAFFFFMIFSAPIPLVAGALPPDCPDRPEDAAAAASEAGKWFQVGIEHAAAGAFDTAGRAFLCSDHLVPHPATLLNIANAAEHAGDSAGAEAAYTEFLGRYPADSRAAAVSAALEAIRPDAGAEDRERDAATAMPPKAAKNDSRPEVESGIEKEPAVGPPERKTPSAENLETDKADEPHPGRKVRAMRAAGFSLLSVGAVTVVTGVITGAVALSYDRDLAQACEDGKCVESEWDKVNAMQGLGTVTTVLLAVGGTLTVVGAVLPIAANRVERKTTSAVSASVTPFAGVRSFGIGIQGAF